MVTEITLPKSTCKISMVSILGPPPVQRRRSRDAQMHAYYPRNQDLRKHYLRPEDRMAERLPRTARIHAARPRPKTGENRHSRYKARFDGAVFALLDSSLLGYLSNKGKLCEHKHVIS